MTVILYGTSAIRQLDASDLGERFIDCVIMEHIDPDLEEAILLRVAQRASDNMGIQSNCKPEGGRDPKLMHAMQLTGGYVEYLRNNAQRLLAGTVFSPQAMRQCMKLAQFVAFMRARPSSKQDESVEREFAARLTSQLVRLAKCLAVVLNESRIAALGEDGHGTQDVMRRVRQIALDTARGKTFDLATYFHTRQQQGIAPNVLMEILHLKQDKADAFAIFLRRIGAVEWYNPRLINGVTRNEVRWRLTKRLLDLYRYVIIELGKFVEVTNV